MRNKAEEPGDDSQNEKTVVDRPTAKQPQKAPKSPGFVDTDSDDSDDEQERIVKKPQKAQKLQSLLIQTQMIWTMNKNM